MKSRSNPFNCLCCLALIVSTLGCTAPIATPDVDAAVAAALAATQTAQANQQATIDSAVAATAGAQPTQTSLPTYTPQPTNAPIPTLAPIVAPTAVNAQDLSQEELSSAVDSSAQEAEAAAAQTSTYTEQASADGTLSAEEVELLMAYAGLTSSEIDQALALADEYLALYAGLAEETLALMTAIEEDLNAMAQSTQALTTSLEEINQAIQQGQEVSQEAIQKLQTQAQEANAKTEQAKANLSQWSTTVQSEMDTRAQALEGMSASQTAPDRAGAISQAQGYLAEVKKSFEDGKISKAELDTIFQSGVNAMSSLESVGGPGSTQMADAIAKMNQQFARGQMPQVKSNIPNLESLVPRR